MIHVIATIEIAPGKRTEFLREFYQIVPEVRAEKGCVEYGPTVDLPTSIPAQPPVREDVVTIVERWETLDDLEAHLIAPHMLAYRTRVKDLVRHATLQILETAPLPPAAQ